MASVFPFPALRPHPSEAAKICELPYDVMSADEAREMAKGNPLSFLHVSRSEIDFPAGTDPYSPAIYTKAAESFRSLIAVGHLVQDPKPCLYAYRQTMGAHAQTGFVGVVSGAEYREGIIRKHEFTRPDKEDDRVRHIEALNAQTGPAFLTYRAIQPLDEILEQVTAGAPAVDFTAADGIRHTSWTIADDARIAAISAHFASIPLLYIADGHHRSAAASRVDVNRQGAGQSGKFLAVIFPHNQLRILPYNRVVADLNGLSILEVLKRLSELGRVTANGQSVPSGKHQVCFYLQSKWHTLDWWPHLLEKETTPIDRLDVSILQNYALSAIFNIQDPRTDKRIAFVGGVRGTQELEMLVNKGKAQIAFSMHPTSVEDLMSIADGNGIMPPKSTWFEPKLRDAMFCHVI